MEINKLFDDVYEIKNFLTDEELKEVFKIIENTPEEKWFSDKTKEDKDFADFWYGKNLHFDKETIFTSINEKMKNLLDSYYYYPDQLILQRYKKGDFINYHADQWNPDLPYYVGYGYCLYFNDDYQGGELHYPDLNIKIKPEANSLYIHGGHIVHGSLPVLDDTIRYFSTVFVRGTTDMPTKLKGDLFK